MSRPLRSSTGGLEQVRRRAVRSTTASIDLDRDAFRRRSAGHAPWFGRGASWPKSPPAGPARRCVNGPMNSVVRTVGCHTCAETSMSLALSASGGLVGLEFGAGIGAAQFDAEREAADGLCRASVDPAGLGFARLPAVDRAVRARPIRNTRPGPKTGENNQQNNQNGRPAATASGMMGWIMRDVKPAECGVSKVAPLLRERPRTVQEVAARHARLIGERLAIREISMDSSFDQATEDLWVFGYGSLIWRPGFDYLERHSGQHHRHASFVMRLFVRSSRHAGAARPRARPRFRRRLPRHRLSRRRANTAPPRSPICAAASRPRRCTASSFAASGLKESRTGGSRRCATRSTAAMRNTPAGCRTTVNCISFGRAMAGPATTATM